MMFKFTYCKNFAHAETKQADWDDFAQVVTRSVGYDTKEQSIKRAAVVGGLRVDESVGRAENIGSRTIASLDYDDLPAGTTLDDVELALSLGLDCAFTSYTTFRHTPEAPRFRVFVPLSRAVTPAEYPAVVETIKQHVGLDGLDDCSYTVNQIMFLASHKNGVMPWSLSQGGEPWAVPDVIAGIVTSGVALDEPDDLDMAIAAQPLDLTADQVNAILDSYPADALDYEGWLRVGMAIWHQHSGSEEGFRIWDAWSALDTERYKKHQMRTKWRSFSARANPVTMASLIKAAGGSRAVAVSADSSVALSLEQEAEQVLDRGTYSAFKKRVQALNEIQLPPDIRSLLAKTVHEVYAKEAGMGLREVKSSFKPIKRSSGGGDNEISAPDWLDGWVYAEADCLFVNTETSDYAIKKEAFRAKFDRMPEVVSLETDAGVYALNMVQIPTVVRPMYWPGQPKLFETDGKSYVNAYHESGIEPCRVIDADGQAVVDLFLAHVKNSIEEPREQEMLLDFMSYICKRPENRVSWGMLLWGIEGNGKTYFYTVLQNILGRNARTITTSMIERPFNDWAVGVRLIGIEEIRIAGTNKWRVLDQLKPMISNKVIGVEPKGATSYLAPNFASYLMTTNHIDAVPMSDNDRRYCVIFTRHKREKDLFDQHGGKEAAGDYFAKLFSESERRVDAIARWLMDRKLSADFNPHGRAPLTKGIAQMRQANVSDDRQALDELIEDYACGIVSDQIIDVTYLNACATMDGKSIPTGRILASILRDKGYSQIENRRIKIKGAYHFVWIAEGDGVTNDIARKKMREWHEEGGEFSEVPF